MTARTTPLDEVFYAVNDARIAQRDEDADEVLAAARRAMRVYLTATTDDAKDQLAIMADTLGMPLDTTGTVIVVDTADHTYYLTLTEIPR